MIHISFPGWNLFIQAFIPVVQVRPQGIALLFPKQVAGLVVRKNKTEHFLDSFFLQRFLCQRNQMACNPHPQEFRMNAHVMDNSASSVMSGQNDANDSAVLYCRKAGIVVDCSISINFPGVAVFL